MLPRDPKIDPQAGDVLHLPDGRFRRVVRRQESDIWYVTHNNPKFRNCWITTWMDWCRAHDFVRIETATL